ncbi:MAG: hypothetical protein ACXWUN_13170 [Allosphingosinicella sp.]
MRSRTISTLAAGCAALITAGCADDYYAVPGYGYHSYPGYAGTAYQATQVAQSRRPYGGDLSGPGLAILDPWLAETVEGRTVVTLGFNSAAEGVISEDVAHRANIWFRRYADENRDMRITDGEIRTALVSAAAPYLR